MQKFPDIVVLDWENQFRIIPSKFPPINFFEKLVNPQQMEELFYLEGLTNDRLREEAGDISLVKPEDRVCGEGASVIMAVFTHIGKPSRFTDGTFGVYYASKEFKTAIFETVFSREKFLAYTNEDPGHIDMRVYVGQILKPLHDVRNDAYKYLHHPEDYSTSQSFALTLREHGSFGMVYNSVRHKGGECIAVLRLPAVSIPKQTKHLSYVWDGAKISRVYEKSDLLFEFD